MAEYIDRAKLIAEYDRVHIGPAGGARKLMVDAPAADVLEVVRCKNCDRSRSMEFYGYCYCKRYRVVRKVDDFCSRAKKVVEKQ